MKCLSKFSQGAGVSPALLALPKTGKAVSGFGSQMNWENFLLREKKSNLLAEGKMKRPYFIHFKMESKVEVHVRVLEGCPDKSRMV